MIKLRENKGILLVSTFVVAAVLSILSSAYVTSSLLHNQATQKQKDSLRAFYAAEKGLEYAYIESQNQNWNWTTHEVANTDLDGDGKINDIVPKTTAPGVTLSGSSINTDPNSDCPGCYQIPTLSGRVELKTYTDPQKSDEIVVLSRDTSGSVLRILKFRISRRSLFKYYYFFPRDKTLDHMIVNGKGAGGIYVNGNIGLGHNIRLSNITELSTNTNSAIYLASSQYTSPHDLDNKIGGIDGKAPLPSSTNPYIYSTNNPFPWESENWPPYSWPPMDWRNMDSHFSRTIVGASLTAGAINGVSLPRTLSTSWEWNKYSGPAVDSSVQFYDANDQLASAAYWNNLQATYGASYFDPAFWNTKTYQRTQGAPTVPVNYLNTANQINDWNTWMANAGVNLNGVVMEKNSGGYDTVPPNIQANYSNLAKQAGLYIGQDASGNTEVYLNGQNLGSALPSWVTDNVQFYNTSRPQDKDSNGVLDKENILQLDFSLTLSLPAEQVTSNGVIYIASKDLRLVNASQLPRSLTIVSPYNIYIKGSYNTGAAWKASAIITNSLVYFISNNFNDPQELPVNIYPRMYPYELQWIDLSKFTPGNTPAQMQNMQNLEYEIKRFFALRPDFNINAPGHQPDDLVELISDIRSQYNEDYQSKMPNLAMTTTFNVAVASPFNPSGYQLERWPGSATMAIKGAFLQLESSWANDANGNPIRNVPVNLNGEPVNYIGRRADYEGNIIPRPNDSGEDPATDPNNSAILEKHPTTEYEERFASERPPADYFSAAQPLWEEVSDFDHNT